MEHEPCNDNFALPFNSHCVSMLTENQVDPRESMKHDSTCRMEVDKAEASLPTKGDLGSVAGPHDL